MPTITFPNSHIATMVRVAAHSTGAEMAVALGLAACRGLLIAHGGAGAMSKRDIAATKTLLDQAVVRELTTTEIAVIDGGTQAGVSQIIGEGRALAGGTFPLIGVCPEAEVSWPGGLTGPDRHPLEPNHSHFILTPGEQWGDETPYLFSLAGALALGAPSLALLVNGGEIAKREMMANVAQSREIIVVRGSGRLADQIAAVWKGELAPSDDAVAEIVRNGQISVIELDEGSAKMVHLIRQKLQNRIGLNTR